MAKDEKTPWLEPGSGKQADYVAEQAGGKLSPDQVAALMHSSALISAAITFKRAVDMLEPIIKAAAAEAKKG